MPRPKPQLYTVGQRIRHGKCYAMTCSERFDSHAESLAYTWIRNSEPTPLYLSGEAYVIGLKRAIMGQYKYHKGYQGYSSLDGPPENEPAYATGKYEECLVCTRQLKPFKPFLVRKCDVVKETESLCPAPLTQPLC